MARLEDDEYEIPLLDQRYFGAGIKRKRVQFVPAISTQAQVSNLPITPASSAASRYLDIVLKSKQPVETNATTPSAERQDAPEGQEDAIERSPSAVPAVCEICNREIASGERLGTHDSSITHQICLQHSHPPSHVDRRRKGLQVLSSHGWDPDSRLGLGAAGEGILHPIKAIENPEKAGLGLRPEDIAKKIVKEKPVKHDAGKVRAMEAEKKRRGEKLRDAFYRSEDVERYLGDGGAQRVGVDLQAFKQVRKNGLR